MAGKLKLTIRAQLYLRCIDDWKAPYEVAVLLGDSPALPAKKVRGTLSALVGRGLAEHGKANDTFRVSDAGRAHLASGKGE